MSLRPLDPVAVPLESAALIEASAGTGKTFTITTLYVRLVLEGLDVRRILVVTYTNAATAELRDRVRRRLREALEAFDGAKPADETLERLVKARREAGRSEKDRSALLGALQSFDEAAIFTIHGFCQRMLQEHAFESGVSFEAELVAEQELLRDEVVRDFWAQRFVDAPRSFVEFLQSENVTFEALERLARKAVANPKLPVVPAEAGEGDLEAPLAAWRRAWQHVAGFWARERGAILALLDRPGVMHRTYFKDVAVRLAPLLDLELATPRPGIVRRFPKIAYFTAESIRERTRKHQRSPRHGFFDACTDLVVAENALAEALKPHVLRLRLDLVDFVRRKIRERKEQANVQSFDDLLHRLDEALEGDGGALLAAAIRDEFAAALIDEFQDTDPVQFAIFRRIWLGTGLPLFLIGDPKQAIYSFRGADVFAYMKARADAQDREYTLDTNQRSDPALIRAVNALFARPKDAFVLGEIPFQPVRERAGARDALAGTAAGSAPFEILIAPGEGLKKGDSERELPRLVAAEISRFLQSGARLATEEGEHDVGPGDVAVLCRTNKQALFTHEALQRLRVPSVLYGDSSVFDTDDALEVERVLRAMAEPSDQAALRAALVTTLVGLDGERVQEFQKEERLWDEIVGQFVELSESWRTSGFVTAFRRMLDEHGVQRRLLALVDGERRLTNVLHLGELLQNAAVAGHRGPLALVEWLHRMRLDPSTRGDLAAEAAQVRLESDARRVKLTTIHQAKGLEYPIVYCPFLWGRFFDPAREGFAFHDPTCGNAVKLDVGSAERDGHALLASREELAESMRLLYVALTRARHRCSIVWGRFADGNGSALGYLLHRPAALPPNAPVDEIIRAVGERITGEGFRQDLERIVTTARGTIVVRDLPQVERGRELLWAGRPEVDEIVPARTAERALDDGWRTSSFTRLAAGRSRISGIAEEGRDHDEIPEDEAALARETAATPVILHELRKGAQAGELLHEILQYLDFTAAKLRVSEEVAARLEGHDFDDGWRERVTQAIVDVLATPLGGDAGNLCLRSVSTERRRSEMEFLFPVAPGGGECLTRERLAEVFRRHGAPADRKPYAERIASLGFQPLAGFLRGFVDLVFEHEGRWYVVDWKSNFLGPAPGDYARPRLVAVMESHHYFLQYHLYAVAAHRFLAARLPGYDYDRCFGGIYYLFLRGMSPAYPRGYGIFHDRPPRGLIEDLSAALGAPRGEDARR